MGANIRKIRNLVSDFKAYIYNTNLTGYVTPSSPYPSRQARYRIIRTFSLNNAMKCIICYKGRLYNCIDLDTEELLSDVWYDEIMPKFGSFEHARVKLNGKYNFLNKEWKLVSDNWFDYGYFGVNDIIVGRNDDKKIKYNVLNEDGSIKCKTWFDWILDSEQTYHIAKLDEKVNIFGKDGKLLLRKWVDRVSGINNDFAIIVDNWKYYLVNLRTGKRLNKVGLKFIGGLTKKYCIAADENGRYNLLNAKGKLLLKKWYEQIIVPNNNNEDSLAVVVNDKGKRNYISNEGKLVLKKWYTDVLEFKNGYGKVVDVKEGERNTFRINFVDLNGRLIWDKPINEWFDYANDFNSSHLTTVTFGDKWNILNGDGKLLLKEGVRWISAFYHDNYIIESDDHKYNLVNADGSLVWDKPQSEWFQEVGFFDETLGLAKVRNDGLSNFINRKGELISDVWFVSCVAYENDSTMILLDDDRVFKLYSNGDKMYVGTKNDIE